MVIFRVTSKCNRKCRTCFVPKGLTELCLERLRVIFRKLSASGVKDVVITGGEPLLRNDFRQIVENAKAFGFRISLDTNADFFFKNRRFISDMVDVVRFSIDSAWVDKDRGGPQKVLRAIKYLSPKSRRPLIRVGTVVTQENVSRLNEIGNLFKGLPVSEWRLFQFIVQTENAIKNRTVLEVSQKQFDRATRRVEREFSRFFKVHIAERHGRNRAYFFIESNGEVTLPVDNGDICTLKVIGTIFDEDIFTKWEKEVLVENYSKNSKPIFTIR